MGKRSGTETVVNIFIAFQKQRTWAQKDLARELQLTTESLRKTLYELMQGGMPLEREEDHPQVYWSIPKGCFPGGLFLTSSEAVQLLRVLARSTHTRERDRLMKRIIEASGTRTSIMDEGQTGVVSPRATEEEENFLPTIEDASIAKTTLSMKYFTSSRGALEERYVSVHRIVLERPWRFVATCHRDHTLKWFRVDNLMRARLSPETPFLEAEGASVDAFLGNSINGYHQGTPSEEHSFVVRAPESRWVKQNLLKGMQGESCEQGLRIKVKTSAPLQVARFVVGLGDSATVETEKLKVMVRELAMGAMGRG